MYAAVHERWVKNSSLLTDSPCGAGQAVVQIVEEVGGNLQYAIKFFLSDGAQHTYM